MLKTFNKLKINPDYCETIVDIPFFYKLNTGIISYFLQEGHRMTNLTESLNYPKCLMKF